MSDSEILNGKKINKIQWAAAIVALCGLADAAFLTIKHYSGAKVPCSIITGCEQVLTSIYAEIFGIPLAVFGALAYFLAFSLAILAIFGNRLMWFLFGVQTTLMTLFTIWLLYLQAFEIQAFCQFCLLSAVITIILFIMAFISKFWLWK